MKISTQKLILGGGLGCAALAVVLLVVLAWPSSRKNGKKEVLLSPPEEEETTDMVTTVKTIHPKLNKSFTRTVTAPAYVEPFFKADLYAHVAGPVKRIHKNIGDQVTEGELLVEIDVPDLVQEIYQKEAIVEQTVKDRDAAVAHVESLVEAVETAKTHILEKQALLEQMVATRDLRKTELRRYEILAARQAITADLVEERQRDVQVAVATCKSAAVAIDTARSEWRGVQAKLAEVRADLKVKEARIQVAQKDRQKMQAQADWAKIRAPFSGVITARNVDPGSFVQNATTAHTQPMLTLMRLDLVTICMMVPERAAPFITAGMEALIHMEVEASKQIQNLRGRVTRFAPHLDPDKGRTMRVEVDLYNPPERGFKRSTSKALSAFLLPLAAAHPYDVPVLMQVGRQVWGRPGLLRPGMYGTMKLVLQRFGHPYVIPSSAVFTHNGKTHIVQVRNCKIYRVPVQVRLEDGVQSMVAVLLREANPETGEGEELQELDGSEEIVPSGQGEYQEGQEVQNQRTAW